MIWNPISSVKIKYSSIRGQAKHILSVTSRQKNKKNLLLFFFFYMTPILYYVTQNFRFSLGLSNVKFKGKILLHFCA